MGEVEKMVQGFLNDAEKIEGISNKYAYALGCLQSKYELLLHDYELMIERQKEDPICEVYSVGVLDS